MRSSPWVIVSAQNMSCQVSWLTIVCRSSAISIRSISQTSAMLSSIFYFTLEAGEWLMSWKQASNWRPNKLNLRRTLSGGNTLANETPGSMAWVSNGFMSWVIFYESNRQQSSCQATCVILLYFSDDCFYCHCHTAEAKFNHADDVLNQAFIPKTRRTSCQEYSQSLCRYILPTRDTTSWVQIHPDALAFIVKSRLCMDCRFGNTSAASTWYILGCIESSAGVKKGDKIWQLGFGGGFKCNSAVWKARKAIKQDHSCWE